MLQRVRDTSNRLLDAQSAEHFEAQRSTGSMISVYDAPFFAESVAYPPRLLHRQRWAIQNRAGHQAA